LATVALRHCRRHRHRHPGRFARERIDDGDQHTNNNEQQDRGPFTLRRTE